MARHGHGYRFWDALDGEGSEECPAEVGPHLPGHPELKGLAVLKEALRLLERHYPETLQRVYFYRPSTAFRVVFAIFRLWVPSSTRERFVLVREGQEERHFFSPVAAGGCGLDQAMAPPEIGGLGEGLDGDRFLLRACEMYDRTWEKRWAHHTVK